MPRDANEPFDTMQPWTIKSVPVRTADAIKRAARQEGLTNGQWLERRVDEWTHAGSPVPVPDDEAPDDEAAPAPRSYRVSDVVGLAAAAVDLADAAVRLASAPDLPVIKAGRGTVRTALLALRSGFGAVGTQAPVRAPAALALAAPDAVPAAESR